MQYYTHVYSYNKPEIYTLLFLCKIILVTEHQIIITQTINMRNYVLKYNSKYAFKKSPEDLQLSGFSVICLESRD